MRQAVAVLAVLGLALQPATAAEIRSCLATAGFDQASKLAMQCAAVIHSGTICRLEQPCPQVVLGIRQGCAMLATNDPLRLPWFCGSELPPR